MFFFLAILCLVLPALILIIMDWVKPSLKSRWLIAISGGISSFIFIILCQLKFPASYILSGWQAGTPSPLQPALLLDSISWPYSFSLVALVVGTISTAGMRQENNSASWIFTFLLAALGILSVSASNPLILVLMWTAMDLLVLGFMVFLYPGGELGRPIIASFSYRLLGTGMFLVAVFLGYHSSRSVGFADIATGSTLLILLAAGLRSGVFPMGLLFPEENTSRKGFFTSYRLVLPTAGLAFLARLPGFPLFGIPNILLFCLLIILAIWAGWKWFTSGNEMAGRPFFITGIFSLMILSSFISDPMANVGLGVTLLLGGAFIFLLSAREKYFRWLAGVCLWSLAAMPFSPAAGIWVGGSGVSWLPLLMILPSQGLLVAGFFRHLVRPGEHLYVSRERWNQIPYAVGLIFLCVSILILGFWGWAGAGKVGTWWVSIMVLVLAGIFSLPGSGLKPVPQVGFLFRRRLGVRSFVNKVAGTSVVWIERVLATVSATLEGEGGIIWSILLLVLILSLLTMGGR